LFQRPLDPALETTHNTEPWRRCKRSVTLTGRASGALHPHVILIIGNEPGALKLTIDVESNLDTRL